MTRSGSRSGRRRPYHTAAVIGGIVVTLVVVVVLVLLTDWSPLIIWLAAVNVTTFAMFGVDKAAAKSDGPRIPEAVLHGFTLSGGFLGQILGRLFFNHKTNLRRHPSFTIVLLVSFAIWAVWLWLYFMRP